MEDQGDLYKALQEVCPWYIIHKPSSTYTCCDMAQMNTLRSNLKLAQQQLVRCPSCYKNFRNVFCAITCDPNASLFMNVREMYSDNMSISAVDIFFTDYYTEKFFNSCKDVENAQDSTKAIDLMCGGNDPCTGPLWLTFMGSVPNSPFILNFTVISDPSGRGLPTNMSAYNATLMDCSDPLNGVKCGCSDCPAVCPSVPTVPPDEGSLKISFIPIGIFVGVIGFVIYSIVFVIVVMVSISLTTVTKHNKLLAISRISQRSFILTNLGHKFENWISQGFSKWGQVAAKYWYVVIPVVMIFVAACCAGLTFFKVTTDPVELWSAPTSRARKEKNYFDQNFGPFYRTSQIIITAPNAPGFTFNNSVHYNIQYEASGIFQQYILNEVSIPAHVENVYMCNNYFVV